MSITFGEKLVNALMVNDICDPDGLTNGDAGLSEYEKLALSIIHGATDQDYMARIDTTGL